MTVVAPEQSLDRATRSGFDLRALWALYTLTLRQHLRGKRWLVMGILFLVPAALSVLTRATQSKSSPPFLEFTFVFMFIPQALLPLVGLLYASGVIQDELEEQTITYLLIRPIPRWALYTVKMLAAITTTVSLTTIFTVITYLAIFIRAGDFVAFPYTRCAHAVGIHCLAVIAYCALFGLFSLFSKRALVFGILYTAIFEGLLANLPLSVRLITVIYYCRIIAFRTMTFAANLATEAWQIDTADDPKLLEHPQVSTCIEVLVISSLALIALGAILCARREFYVKTPEKS